jgi:elongation factor Ts
MEINSTMVKDLREKTGVGMMDCKKALQESAGDMEKAIEWLRKKGISKSAKRADRAASKGVFGLYFAPDHKHFTAVELNCETDFVAKNEDFVKMANDLAAHVAAHGTTDEAALRAEKFAADASKTVGDLLAEAVAKIGEAIRFGKIVDWKAAGGENFLGLYVHTGAAAIGLTELTGATGADAVELGKNLGMQIVASKPAYLAPADVPAAVLEKEKEIYREEAKAAGKPEKILDKIAEGKLAKFYQDNCLLNQIYVKDTDGSMTVETLVKKAGVSVLRFARLMVGQS